MTVGPLDAAGKQQAGVIPDREKRYVEWCGLLPGSATTTPFSAW